MARTRSVVSTISEVKRDIMWRRLITKPVLLFSIALAVLLWIGESLFHYLVFDPGHPFEIIPSDQNELWMRLVICAMIVVFGGYIQRQANKKRAIQEEKLRTLRATMHTVEDRVGNTLLSIKYLLNDAENNQCINLQLSNDIHKLIDNTMQQLREIRNLNVVSEKRFNKDTFYLDTDRERNTHLTS